MANEQHVLWHLAASCWIYTHNAKNQVLKHNYNAKISFLKLSYEAFQCRVPSLKPTMHYTAQC